MLRGPLEPVHLSPGHCSLPPRPLLTAPLGPPLPSTSWRGAAAPAHLTLCTAWLPSAPKGPCCPQVVHPPGALAPPFPHPSQAELICLPLLAPPRAPLKAGLGLSFPWASCPSTERTVGSLSPDPQGYARGSAPTPAPAGSPPEPQLTPSLVWLPRLSGCGSVWGGKLHRAAHSGV